MNIFSRSSKGKKANKKLPGGFGSKQRQRLIIVVLAVALIGVLYLRFTRAEARPVVRYLYLYANNQSQDTTKSGWLSGLASETRNFYSGQVGRAYDMQNLGVKQGSRSVDQYIACPSAGACTEYERQKALLSRLSAEGHTTPNSITVVITQFHTNTSGINCGVGDYVSSNDYSYGAIVYATANCQSYARTREASAHELGHGLGLARDGGGHTPYAGSDGPLMVGHTNNGICDNDWSRCYLSAIDKTYLQNTSAVFRVAPANPAPQGDFYSNDDDNAPYACAYQSGWAIDQSDKNVQINLHIYVDGSLLQGITANNRQGDANFRNIFGVDDVHGWTWTIPDSLKNGVPHTVEFYVIDHPTGNDGNNRIGVRTINCRDTTPPAAPTGLRTNGSVTGSSIPLAWDANAGSDGVTSYELVISGGTNQTINVGNVTSYNVTGLSTNTNYSFVLRAKDAQNNTSGNSNTVSAKTSLICTTGICLL